MKNPVIEIDQDLDQWEWDEKMDEFDYWFERVFPKGEVGMIGKNHGWRKLDGYRPVEFFNQGCRALGKAMVSGASAKVFLRRNSEYGYHIAINTAHHDSPCWDEWTYLVRPSKFKELV